MKGNNESENHTMTNEEYRERLNNIFSQIDNNDVLCYYYTYISEKEKIRQMLIKNEKNGA